MYIAALFMYNNLHDIILFQSNFKASKNSEEVYPEGLVCSLIVAHYTAPGSSDIGIAWNGAALGILSTALEWG